MYPGGNSIDAEEEQAVLDVLRAKRLFRYYGPNPGPSQAEELEKEFATHTGVQHALGVTSGTAALICGLRGIGVGPGDEVIVPGIHLDRLRRGRAGRGRDPRRRRRGRLPHPRPGGCRSQDLALYESHHARPHARHALQDGRPLASWRNGTA